MVAVDSEAPRTFPTTRIERMLLCLRVGNQVMSQELVALLDLPLHNVWGRISNRICCRTELLDMG